MIMDGTYMLGEPATFLGDALYVKIKLGGDVT